MWARSGRTDLATALLCILLLACHHEPQYHPDAALRADLREMRAAIDRFHAEQHRYPASLSELKQMHYLRDIPIDPITGARNWRVTTEETVSNDDFSKSSSIGKGAGGATVVIDVHSAAGKPYSDY
jgi:general secretion pathway protein G